MTSRDQMMECPFCGGNELGIGRSTEDREGFPTYIYCAECGAQGPYIYTRKPGMWTCTELAAQETGWNTRPTAVAYHAEGEADDPKTDREALVYLMRAFDTESWQCPRCGHDDDCATMDSAYFLRDYLRTHPPRSGDEAEPTVRNYRMVEDARDAAHGDDDCLGCGYLACNKCLQRAVSETPEAFDAARWRQFLSMVDPDKVQGGFTLYFAIEEGTDQLCYADNDITEIVDAAMAARGGE